MRGLARFMFLLSFIAFSFHNLALLPSLNRFGREPHHQKDDEAHAQARNCV
jgi:hypothetical protein